MCEPPASPRCDSALAALVVPARPRLGTYEVCETPDLPESALRRAGFGAAEPEHLEVLDALGTAGAYNRARILQLYGGRRLDVRRAWRVVDGRFESMTTISPYPDPSLTALHEGTLLIRWTVPLSR